MYYIHVHLLTKHRPTGGENETVASFKKKNRKTVFYIMIGQSVSKCKAGQMRRPTLTIILNLFFHDVDA